jgi:hypothetical protein
VTVYCADAACAPGEICCWNTQDANLDHCGDAGACGGGYSELSCNGPEDCPGAICCGDFNGNGYDGVYCQASCNGGNKIIMCNGDPSVCPQGTQCNQSNYLGQGYMFCQ